MKTIHSSAKKRPAQQHKPEAPIKKPRIAPAARQQPVTQDSGPESDSDEEDLREEDEDEDADENEYSMDAEDTAQEQGPPKQTAKESHAQQKALQQQRKAAKRHADILIDAKKHWAHVRQTDLTKEQRQKHVRLLMDAVRGNVQEIVFKHDASRIIQSLVKYGGQAERDAVAAELKGRYKELAQNKYSKFLVTKLVRYCPKSRPAILAEFHGHVIRMLLHRESSRVISDVFELYASAAERAKLVREFYGKEMTLFTSVEDGRTLRELLKDADGVKRRRVLDAMKQNLLTVFNNPEKGAITYAITHRVLLEFLQEVNRLEDEEGEKLRREMFENAQELLAEMVHTKDGSRAVREFIAWGSAKDRKMILKVLKPHIEKMCSIDEGQLVLFTALDVIDDTKLLAKSLVSSMTATMPNLKAPTCTTASRRSILYLLTPRSPKYFTPAIVKTLEETDPIRDKTSKKDVSTRQDEVRKAASPDLLQFLEKRENIRELVSNAAASLVVTDIMLFSDGDTKAAAASLLSTLIQQPEDKDAALSTASPHVARLLKTLLQGGHFSQTSKSVERSPHFDSSGFARLFVDTLGEERILEMTREGGTFVVVELLEALDREASLADRRKLVGSWFSPEIKKEIGSSDIKGRDLLLEKIKGV